MRTRRSQRNQDILWRALGNIKPIQKVKRTPLMSRADARKLMFSVGSETCLCGCGSSQHHQSATATAR